MCLALANVLFFELQFCSSMNLDKQSLSLPDGDKMSIMPYTVGLQVLQELQNIWAHAKRCVLPQTQSQYLLLFWYFKAVESRHLTLTFRLGYELLLRGGYKGACWRRVGGSLS